MLGKFIIVACMVLGLAILAIGLQGLIYWGIGVFVCWAFNIPFERGFVHGIALAFIVSILASIFSYRKDT